MYLFSSDLGNLVMRILVYLFQYCLSIENHYLYLIKKTNGVDLNLNRRVRLTYQNVELSVKD